jgi:hypothetical protein
VKKVFPTEEKYRADKILEKINEKYEKFERGFLRHLRKHMKYKGEALPVFNFGAAENELGDKSPVPEAVPEEFPEGKEESEEAEVQNE